MSTKNILVVAATALEIESLFEHPRISSHDLGRIVYAHYADHTVDVLITGPGMISTAYHMGRQLEIQNYDLVINAGIAGSFNENIKIGDAVNVVSDCFPELGAYQGDRFIPMYGMEMALPYKQSFISSDGVIENFNFPDIPSLKKLPAVKGITVNTISNNEVEIENLRIRTSAEIESMEGAAFLYSCFLTDSPCLQIRTISNYVEPLHLAKWDIPLAVSRLRKTLIQIFDEL
jgi:futalosine hydrolase